MAGQLLAFAIVAHLVGDFLLQNEWMALNKSGRRRIRGMLRGGAPVPGSWWDRHPSAYVHAAIHGAVQLVILGPIGAVVVAVTHFLIDLRAPVAWWSRLIRQTQPEQQRITLLLAPQERPVDRSVPREATLTLAIPRTVMDIGADVRIWADQTWHLAVLALVALAVGGSLG